MHFGKESNLCIELKLSISLSFSKPIISLKIFNYENKSNSSRSNKLSCLEDFSIFKHFSFKNVQSRDCNFLTPHKKKYLHIF